MLRAIRSRRLKSSDPNTCQFRWESWFLSGSGNICKSCNCLQHKDCWGTCAMTIQEIVSTKFSLRSPCSRDILLAAYTMSKSLSAQFYQVSSWSPWTPSCFFTKDDCMRMQHKFIPRVWHSTRAHQPCLYSNLQIPVDLLWWYCPHALSLVWPGQMPAHPRLHSQPRCQESSSRTDTSARRWVDWHCSLERSFQVVGRHSSSRSRFACHEVWQQTVQNVVLLLSEAVSGQALTAELILRCNFHEVAISCLCEIEETLKLWQPLSWWL